MEIVDYPLTCHRIGSKSLKNEGSDFVILPESLKPKKPNLLGYYVFKVSSDVSTKWTYCRVKEWSKEERDCYLPTWMMNYLHIPNFLVAKFTYGDFSLPKGESVVLQPTDEIFASYSFMVELSAIRSALCSYTTLTNNSRITITVDGQKFSVIVRLLKPEDRVRTSSKMDIVVSKTIYRTRGKMAVDESTKYEEMNIVQDDSAELLKGLCTKCYRPSESCICAELKQTRVESPNKEGEKEARRIAIETLEKTYCMNCFRELKECQCSEMEKKAMSVASENAKPVKETVLTGEEDLDEQDLDEEDFDIMQVVEKEMQAELEARRAEKAKVVEQRRRELEQQGQTAEEAIATATAEIEAIASDDDEDKTIIDDDEDSPLPQESQEAKEAKEAKETKEAQGLAPIAITEDRVDKVMEAVVEKRPEIFYFWDILPNEHCKRWMVKNAVMIPPPPPDIPEKESSAKVARRNSTLWSIFKRSTS